MKILFFSLVILLTASCSGNATDATTNGDSATKENTATPTNGKSIVVDVRSIEEWNTDGHSDCSVNYPLDELESHKAELLKYDQVTFVCKSGGRAGQATDWLSSLTNGTKVTNGGAWQEVSCK